MKSCIIPDTGDIVALLEIIIVGESLVASEPTGRFTEIVFWTLSIEALIDGLKELKVKVMILFELLFIGWVSFLEQDKSVKNRRKYKMILFDISLK